VSPVAQSILTDKSYLTTVQYQNGANLAARQSIYAFQQPRIDLVASVLQLAGLLGVDLSPGMLAATRAAVPGASLSVGDAAAGQPVTGIVAEYEASYRTVTLDTGAELLAEVFSSVERYC
jgi:hypothetical protein